LPVFRHPDACGAACTPASIVPAVGGKTTAFAPLPGLSIKNVG